MCLRHYNIIFNPLIYLHLNLNIIVVPCISQLIILYILIPENNSMTKSQGGRLDSVRPQSSCAISEQYCIILLLLLQYFYIISSYLRVNYFQWNSLYYDHSATHRYNRSKSKLKIMESWSFSFPHYQKGKKVQNFGIGY